MAPRRRSKLPKCRWAMVKRRSKSGSMFWGCSEFPSCRGTIAIEAKH
ncbi:MAG: topoisomerase DNA-binding C4 zinc finger domain-containing protein [Verrucomicrobiota bacterium]